MAESNVELARRGFAAVLRGDFDVIRDLLDPDVKWHGGDPSAEGACQNRDQALAFMRLARERLPDAELLDVVDAGDRVVVIIGPEPRANVTTFRNGKVVEMVAYAEVDEALAAARGGQASSS